MNVLYLNTHDIGRYLQTYGYPVHTPNLLRLSREGMAFTQMYCASPTCSPSRGAMLTGQYPHNNGLIGLSHRGFRINGKHHLTVGDSRRGAAGHGGGDDSGRPRLPQRHQVPDRG